MFRLIPVLHRLRNFTAPFVWIALLGLPALAEVKPAAPAAVPPPPALTIPDVRFTTPLSLEREAIALVQLLEEDHYNRAAVHAADYGDAIPAYMMTLDSQHLFFLAGDEEQFARRYGKEVYYNTRIGNIDAAYDIFYVYRQRVQDRIRWIMAALKQAPDFTANETYGIDRSKADWPGSAAEADDLWRRRLKFELLAEMLNKKTPEQARDVVRKRYERMPKNVAEFEGPELAELYLTAITERYDPHSAYLLPESFKSFGIQMKLELVGIGALLEDDDDYCTVKELIPGGPADLGRQLKPNDRILSVAQEGSEPVDIIGMKLTKVVEMIRGAKGTRVHLMVQPAAATDTSTRKEVVITRDKVKLNSARAHAGVFQVPGAGGKTVPLGVITLPTFYGPGDDPDDPGSSASQDVARLIGQLREAGVQGLVLDLRHNGGGFLSEAINLTGLFIPPGPVVQVRDNAGRIAVDNDDATAPIWDGPMAVLVDRFSASASEIVAGALQNYGRAIVVGDKSTHGKGTVQTIAEMKNVAGLMSYSPERTGAAKITIQKFYLPNGASTQLDGVSSDVPLPSIDDYLPIGESDLPHALIWDRIPPTAFDGAPIAPKLLTALKHASAERQAHLEEFAYLQKNVDWFQSRQAEKLVSLNGDERKKEQADDDAFRKEMKATRGRLAKADYPYQVFWLGPPPPPPTPPDAKKSDADSADREDLDDFEADASKGFSKVDVDLRETLRILNDAIDLGRDHEYWVSNHPPLAVGDKG